MPVEVAAYQWSKMLEIAMQDIETLSDLRVLEVRHEELLADPRAQAKRIVEFAEIEWPDEVVALAEGYLKQDYVHWEQLRESHGEAELESIRHIVAPMASRLGYRLEENSGEAKHPDSPDASNKEQNRSAI